MKMKQTQTLLSPFDPRGKRCVDGAATAANFV